MLRTGGERFGQRIDGLDPLYCRPIAVKPADPDVAVVVATDGASTPLLGITTQRTGGALTTSSRGARWQQVDRPGSRSRSRRPRRSSSTAGRTPARFYLPLFSGEVSSATTAALPGAPWSCSGLPPILRATVA